MMPYGPMVGPGGPGRMGPGRGPRGPPGLMMPGGLMGPPPGMGPGPRGGRGGRGRGPRGGPPGIEGADMDGGRGRGFDAGRGGGRGRGRGRVGGRGEGAQPPPPPPAAGGVAPAAAAGAAPAAEPVQLSLPAMLANATPEQQKQILGERLFPLVQAQQPELAGKITGMLLEMDNSEVLLLLDNQEALDAKVGGGGCATKLVSVCCCRAWCRGCVLAWQGFRTGIWLQQHRLNSDLAALPTDTNCTHNETAHAPRNSTRTTTQRSSGFVSSHSV